MADFEVIFANVGQGDCTLIRLPDGKFMLVDVYRCPGQGIDIFKLLEDALPDGSDGRKKLDILAITHAHDDHITGIGELYERFEVDWLWVPQHEDRKQIAKHFGDFQDVVDKHPAEKVLRPQGSRTPLDTDFGDGVTVRCFSPPGFIEIDEALTEEEAKKVVHENCLVLKVGFNGTSVTLTGDSDVACWKRVVGYYAGRSDEETGTEVLDCTVLHASHHGSRTFIKEGGEDSEAWLDGLKLLAPEVIVVSVGEDNRHDHPHKDMISAYEVESGAANVHETRETGTVVLGVNADGGYELTLDGADGAYARAYGWDDDGGDEPDGPIGGGRGGPKISVPAPPPPAPKPKPDKGRRYG